MMDIENTNIQKLHKLHHILNTTVDLLPIENSLIAFEIILETMSYHYRDDELSLKVIFSSKKFTEMGARFHLNRLVKNEWIISEKSIHDLRVKTIRPTEKLIKIFDQFLKTSFN